MKRTTKLLILTSVLLVGVMVLGTIACGKKEEKPVEPPVVEAPENDYSQEDKRYLVTKMRYSRENEIEKRISYFFKPIK